MENSCTVVSFPKCGRTWLKQLMNIYQADSYRRQGQISVVRTGLADKEKVSYLYDRTIEKLTLKDRVHNLTATEAKYIHFTHSVMEAEYQDKIKFYHTELIWHSHRVKEWLPKGKVVLLVRDPRDVVVSYYYQKKFREPWMTKIGTIKWAPAVKKSIDEFVADEIYGIRQIVAFFNLWADKIKTDKNFIVISYEDLRKNTYREMKKILHHFDIRVKRKPLKKAIELSTFAAMRKVEAASLNEANISIEDECYKARKGLVGSYKENLPDKTIDFINRYLSGCLDPVFERYSPVRGVF